MSNMSAVCEPPSKSKQSPKRLAVDRDPQEVNRLVEENLGLALKPAYYWAARNPDLDPDAIVSEAMLALWRAARSYNPALGYKFSTLATMACQRNIFKYLENARRQKRLLPTIRLNPRGYCPYAVHRDRNSVPNQVIEKEERRISEGRMARAMTRLTPARAKVVGALVYGDRTRLELETEMQVTRQAVDNAYHTGIRQLGQMYIDEQLQDSLNKPSRN